MNILIKLNLRKLFLEIGFVQLLLSLFLLFSFDFGSIAHKQLFHFYNQDWFSYSFGYDILSILFIVLTSLIVILCILINWNLKYKVKEFLILLFLIDLMLINVFCILDLFMFYVYFETILVPMFLLIGI